jgi:serine/threonine-protein kinase
MTDHQLREIGLNPGLLLQARYRIIRELGRGPASQVCLAQDHHQGDLVALKAMLLSPRERLRVRRDVMAAWEIDHPHVIPVHGCFEVGDRIVVAMGYVDGPDLESLVRSGPLSADQAAAIGRGVALGLQAAHRHGVLHHHVTPRNILVGPEVRACLGDFGSSGISPGSSASGFGAPEVAGGQRPDGRGDIFGLGMSLFFAVTGRLPERSRPDQAPLAAADGYRPSRLRPTVPAWFDDAIAIATAALPADRFSSPGRLAAALAPNTSLLGALR